MWQAREEQLRLADQAGKCEEVLQGTVCLDEMERVCASLSSHIDTKVTSH